MKTDRLADRLGYTFNDIGLLEKALSHRSYGKNNNERLEFLGDALVGFIIAESLYQKFPDATEGDLSRLRSSLVKGETLASIARDLNLGDYLLLGSGELKSGGHRRDSILADCVEALAGAVYLDGGFDECTKSVLNLFASRLNDIQLDTVKKDPKTRLQEFLQERRWPLPEYKLLKEDGEAHSRLFVIECRLVNESLTASASDTSKRGAEKQAAEKVLAILEKKYG